MAKKGAPTLFNPRPSRPTLPKKETPVADTPSPGSSSQPALTPNPQSAPGTPKKPPAATASPATRPAPQRRAPAPKTEDDTAPKQPDGPFTEYRLMSSKLNGWKYDVMKFESRKKVEINDWARPVKLNRKDPHRNDPTMQPAQQALAHMVGSDGKLVIGQDGKVVMVDALGRPVREPVEQKEDKGKDKDKKPKRFQKKTRQVFLVPEATRQLRREEKFPWVIEDGMQKETWVGKMEDVSKSQTYAMFMPAANDVFKFVPAHRWYKFQKKPSHHIPNLEEAESLMTKLQKRKDATQWALRQKTEQAAASGSSLVHNASQSLGPGGKKLRTVDSGPGGLFGDGDDDDEGGDSKRRVKRELGAEGFLDELDFEETFADDEDKMEHDDKEDEETKELEERLKREYKTANKLREGFIDESDDEEDESKLTGAGKNLQKTLKKLEKGGGYDESDDEKNPYASSQEEEEEEEEPPQVHTGPAILPPEPKPGAPLGTQTPPGPPTGAKAMVNGTVPVKTETPSRATSPVPGHSGHSIVAKRATSPKVPKPKTGMPSRAGSPLASPTGASPPASRATSPGRADSPPSGVNPPPEGKLLKRKADDASAASSDGPPRPKKRKAPGELEDRMVIEWLRNTPNATTRECIMHFTRYLTDDAKKAKFTALVKEVAQLSNGVLVLRPAYRGGNAGAPSPPAAG
ncbi:hypothetical protein BD311DRAFT_774930 [Dichomitus squalens]|uniref:Transcription initiation factor IIF subunit alpha n=1 Tax=Dichomitus squalens TaxID=114155 RepID=A0A4Q9MXB5_9APHY|nr:hypothetical protein BD311DRAFT_774930 [Dichomitus squalens]